MDWGISENDFWNMTIAELNRVIEAKKRVQKAQLMEKAFFDYTLADLIGRSVARIHSSTNHWPKINEVYPTLYEAEEIEEQEQKRKDDLSAIRFRQFAEAFNSKFKEGGNKS